MSYGWLHEAAAWVLIAAEVEFFGTAVFAALLRPVAAGSKAAAPPFVRMWRWTAVAAVAFAPLALVLKTAEMAQVPARAAVTLLPEVLAETHQGHVWAMRLPVLLLVLLATWAIRPGRLQTGAILFGSTILIGLRAVSGHAIDYGAWAIGAVAIHEGAVGVWIGALLGLRKSGLDHGSGGYWFAITARRVSTAAACCVGVAVLSGLFLAYLSLGLNLDHLLYSLYGHTLMAKVGVLLIALGVAASNRRLVPFAAEPEARRSLMRNVRVETVLVFGIIAIAVLLAGTPPVHR